MLVSIVPHFQICISLHVTVIVVSCLMIASLVFELVRLQKFIFIYIYIYIYILILLILLLLLIILLLLVSALIRQKLEFDFCSHADGPS